MKKRIFGWVCAAALCVGLLGFVLPANATGNPCFMAVNDTILALEDESIPVQINGQYYAPHSVFDSGVTGLWLGVYPIYNVTLNTLTIYSPEKGLTFDLSAGTCKDNGGKLQSAHAVVRNGRVYVPLRFICEYFGLAFSVLSTDYGPLVRVRGSSYVLNDVDFPTMARRQLEERLREWRQNQPEQDPVVTPTPTPTPTPTLPPDVGQTDLTVYLSFRADRIDGLNSLLDRLKQNGVYARFFFPAEELAEYDDAVRAVLCEGHGVGLSVSGETAEEIVRQAEEGNRVLARIAHLYSNVVLAPGADSAVRAELKAAGLFCLTPDVDALPDGRSAYTQAAAIMNKVEEYSDEVYLLSDSSSEGAALAGRLIPSLVQKRCDLRLVLETNL